MKKFMAAIAVAASLALTVSAASAFQCPTLIKQGRDAAATMKADDPKVKEATAKLDEAQKLHSEGKHADSVKTANDALALLGVKK